jgi:hypothetical protein
VEHCFDQGPCGDFETILGFLASDQTSFDEPVWSKSFHSTTTSQFFADRVFIYIEQMCNFRLVVSCPHKGIGLVCLFLGKPRLGSHRRFFDLVDLRSTVASAAFFLTRSSKLRL